MKRIMISFGEVKTFATAFYVAKMDIEQMTELYLSQRAFCDPYKAINSIKKLTDDFDNTAQPQQATVTVWADVDGKLQVEKEKIGIKWIKTT